MPTDDKAAGTLSPEDAELCRKLDAAAADERLADGALYRRAATRIRGFYTKAAITAVIEVKGAELIQAQAARIEALSADLERFDQKDRIKTHEINVLVPENRELRARAEALSRGMELYQAEASRVTLEYERRAVAAEARAEALEKALRKLRNEAAALAFRKGEIIEAISQTNWDCLQTRISEADAALAAERKE